MFIKENFYNMFTSDWLMCMRYILILIFKIHAVMRIENNKISNHVYVYIVNHHKILAFNIRLIRTHVVHVYKMNVHICHIAHLLLKSPDVYISTWNTQAKLSVTKCYCFLIMCWHFVLRMHFDIFHSFVFFLI